MYNGIGFSPETSLLPLPHLEEYRIEAIIKTLQQKANATPSITLAAFTEV